MSEAEKRVVKMIEDIERAARAITYASDDEIALLDKELIRMACDISLMLDLERAA